MSENTDNPPSSSRPFPQQPQSADYESNSSGSSSHSSSSSKHQPSKKEIGDDKISSRPIRYKYCCKVCKHTDAHKKACVCVVPLPQRRAAIGSNGCQTCGCHGCSKEDYLSRGEDPEYRPEEKFHQAKEKEDVTFQARNGCCRKCMKAFSKTNKSCLCQVPEDVRKTKLPSNGCKICGCNGCNPEDKKDPKHRKSTVPPNLPSKRQRSRSRQKKKKQKERKRSESSNSRQYIDAVAMNFFNIQRSVIGSMIINEYRLPAELLGFGVPQRTQSYIIGKPK